LRRSEGGFCFKQIKEIQGQENTFKELYYMLILLKKCSLHYEYGCLLLIFVSVGKNQNG